MFGHGHIAAHLFGPSSIARPTGAPLPQGQSAPYQQIYLGSDGAVVFKRNAPHVDGRIYSVPWPMTPLVGVTKAW